MKKALKLVSVLMSAVLLVCAFASCGKEDNTPKITVEIAVYNGAKGENIIVGQRNLSLDEGATALDAMNALVSGRGVTFTTGTDGQFVNITYNGKKVEGSQTTLPDGKVEMKKIGWMVNDVAMTGASTQTETAPKDKVLATGDVISIFIETLVVEPDKR